MVSLYDASREDITTLLEGQPAFRIKQVWEGLYQQFVEPAQMLTLPVALRNKLNEYADEGTAIPAPMSGVSASGYAA